MSMFAAFFGSGLDRRLGAAAGAGAGDGPVLGQLRGHPCLGGDGCACGGACRTAAAGSRRQVGGAEDRADDIGLASRGGESLASRPTGISTARELLPLGRDGDDTVGAAPDRNRRGRDSLVSGSAEGDGGAVRRWGEADGPRLLPPKVSFVGLPLPGLDASSLAPLLTPISWPLPMPTTAGEEAWAWLTDLVPLFQKGTKSHLCADRHCGSVTVEPLFFPSIQKNLGQAIAIGSAKSHLDFLKGQAQSHFEKKLTQAVAAFTVECGRCRKGICVKMDADKTRCYGSCNAACAASERRGSCVNLPVFEPGDAEPFLFAKLGVYTPAQFGPSGKSCTCNCQSINWGPMTEWKKEAQMSKVPTSPCGWYKTPKGDYGCPPDRCIGKWQHCALGKCEIVVGTYKQYQKAVADYDKYKQALAGSELWQELFFYPPSEFKESFICLEPGKTCGCEGACGDPCDKQAQCPEPVIPKCNCASNEMTRYKVKFLKMTSDGKLVPTLSPPVSKNSVVEKDLGVYGGGRWCSIQCHCSPKYYDPYRKGTSCRCEVMQNASSDTMVLGTAGSEKECDAAKGYYSHKWVCV